MAMTEIARLILGLRDAGWSEKTINDFLIYMESGDDAYRPKRDEAEESHENPGL
ncbi:MAG: hypothetical protein IJT94_07970 [Oscillibacter sp.]|nr:hypothetical protein [Oscillibacter sp.]